MSDVHHDAPAGATPVHGRPVARARRLLIIVLLLAGVRTAAAQGTIPKPFEPEIGQGGKDVVWVPTPPALVEKMLDMAQVTAADLVMDLGSGDGRNVIAAARRGARAIGVEYNANMVALSTRLAEEAGVAGRATFVEGDMFTADISEATVMALFLLPANLERLRDTFLRLAPGTRLVMNTFDIPDWAADEKATLDDGCVSWCTAHLYYVPAKVDGRWTTSHGALTLRQAFQVVAGTLATPNGEVAVSGRLRGAELTLQIDGTSLRTTVRGDRLEGGALTGTRTPQ